MPATLETAHLAVCDLIRLFQSNQQSYLSPQYQEAEARKDFIDKFFKALGWDVDHDTQTNPAEQEVKIERGVAVAAAQKRADYAFYAAPNFRDVRFFVEAKKPSVELDRNADAYFQALRYGWNANTPLAVLTDFEQFHVLDCRAKPDIRDALKRAHKTYRYTEFFDRQTFAEVYWLFSREAFADGAFDRYVAKLPKPKDVAKQKGFLRASFLPVDASFLTELEAHRETLAKAFKRDNPTLDGFTLTEVTQRVLDRLVFLRFLEDKLIETEISVGGFARSGSAWRLFVDDSRRLNARYNGAVYKPHPLIDTGKLAANEDDFRAVCEALSAQYSPYDFNAIPIHILGSIYERFLGKVIVATEAGAAVEEKPEVRKAGGVYYTPEYIVRYIVDATVGAQIKDKTPEQISKLRFADIACGSGSFLLNVFDTVLRYHTHWFNEHPERAARAGCVETDDGTWRLSLQQRRQILLNNVFGVDIDRQAVEVTQISLYLKLLEEETTASAHQYELQLHETLLPDLRRNIVCGNSLIGTDILEGQIFATDEERALNPMNFEDAFPEVMRQGGFDAIVGNPPYVRQEGLKQSKAYFRDHFDSFAGTADLYVYFMERAVKLLRRGGLYSIIVSSSFLRATYAEALRTTLKREAAVIRLVDFGGLAVFADAKDTYVCIPLLAKADQPERIEIAKVGTLDTGAIDNELRRVDFTIPQDRFADGAWSLKNDAESALFSKIVGKGIPLGEYVFGAIYYGIKTGANEAFVIDSTTRDRLTADDPRLLAFIHPLRGGEDCRRYSVNDTDSWLIVVPSGFTQRSVTAAPVPETEAWAKFSGEYPTLAGHLGQYSDVLKKRSDMGDYWWELRPCAYYDTFGRPKIVFPDIAKSPRFCLDRSSLYLSNTAYMLDIDDSYLLAILNSRLAWFALTNISIPFGIRAGEYRYRLFSQYLEKIPIRRANLDDPADKSKHDRMVQLVEQMLDAKKKQAAAQSEADTDYWTRRCDAIDRQIDGLVYELYGLSEDEIAIVEGR